MRRISNQPPISRMSSPNITYRFRTLWVMDVPLYELEYLGTKSGDAGRVFGLKSRLLCDGPHFKVSGPDHLT